MKNNYPAVYFPNLDALRFFCFISIFFEHCFATNYETISSNPSYEFIKHRLFGNAALGVNFFFVLSGFLITYLLLVEKTTFQRIDIKKFYFRRALRIWPLFYFIVLFGFLIFPFLKSILSNEPSSETANPLYYMVFLNNFDMLNNGHPDSSTLAVLWSVAIEEQFYLVWPLIISFIATKRLPYVFVFIILSSFIFRLTGGEYQHTISSISDMTVGGVGAYLILYSYSFKKKIKSLSRTAIFTVYFLCFILYLFKGEIFNHTIFLSALDRLITSILL